jgi:hypothetical protein
MTTDIWIDPAELNGTAGMLAEQALRIQEAAVGTRENCVCDAPRSMVGWIDEALVALTEDALKVAVGYLTQAVDVATRASEVIADQAVDTTAGTGAGVDPSVAIIGGTTVGGTGPAFTTDLPAEGLGLTATIGKPNWSGSPLLQAMEAMQSTNPGLSAGLGSVLSQINQSQDDMIGTILAPNGLTMDDGQLVDGSGHVGGYGNVVEDPYRPGSYDIDP